MTVSLACGSESVYRAFSKENDSQNAFCESIFLNCESMYQIFCYICGVINQLTK